MKKLILPLIFCSGSFLTFSQNLPVAQTPLNKNAVLEELTGKACQFCPSGHKIANTISAAHPGRVILVNIHSGSYANGTPNYKTTDGNALDGFFNPGGYPAGSVQRKPYGSETFLATSRSNWSSQVNVVLAQASPVNIALDATIDAATRIVTVNVEAFYTSPFANGTNHYINVGILQDDLESSQTGAAAYYPEMIQPNGLYQHKHMFRGYINTGGTWGDQIDASQGTVITRTYTYTLPATISAVDLNIGKLKFFALVHEGHNAVSNSAIITGAQVTPTYTNVPSASGNLNSIVNSFNVCDGESITPVVKVVNNGDIINSMNLTASVNGGTPVPFIFSGTIAAFGSAEITLPSMVVAAQGTNNVVVQILSVNGSAANVGAVATQTKPISIASTAASNVLTVKMTTDGYGSETTWKLFNSSNVVVASGGPYANGGSTASFPQADVVVTVPANDCYRAVIYDSYGDGFDSGYGNGDFKILSNGVTVASIPNFTSAEAMDVIFVTASAGIEELSTINMSVFPNPATDVINVTFDAQGGDYIITLTDLSGRVMSTNNLTNVSGKSNVSINVDGIKAGNYLISLANGSSSFTKMVTVQ